MTNDNGEEMLERMKRDYNAWADKLGVARLDDKRLEDVFYSARRHFPAPAPFMIYMASVDKRGFEFMQSMLLQVFDEWFSDHMEGVRRKFEEFKAIYDPRDDKPYSTYQNYVKILDRLRAEGAKIEDFTFVTASDIEAMNYRDVVTRGKLH
jgi:hypothetical protein